MRHAKTLRSSIAGINDADIINLILRRSRDRWRNCDKAKQPRGDCDGSDIRICILIFIELLLTTNELEWTLIL